MSSVPATPDGAKQEPNTDEPPQSPDPDRDTAGADVDPARIDECARLLERLSRDPRAIKHTRFRALRKAIAPFMYNAFDMPALRRANEAAAARQAGELHARRDKRRRDRALLDTCALRSRRLRRRKALLATDPLHFPAPRVPDGPGDDADSDDAADAEDETRSAPPRPAACDVGVAVGRLLVPRRCHVCRQRFSEVHAFYDRLCTACGDYNFAKRSQTADLGGYVALVTGARVKIGLVVALKLLRAGAHVIATSRFPHDAALRFAREPDHAEWKGRLHVYGLDLRDLPRLEAFCAALHRGYSHLDILINNACQTIRRPPAFYRHLLATELQPPALLPEAARDALQGPARPLPRPAPPSLTGVQRQGAVLDGAHPMVADAQCLGLRGVDQPHGAGSPACAGPPGMLSQLALVEGDDAAVGSAAFPADARDAHGQQLDLRERNSWVLRLAEVPTVEAAEVLLVNSLAPFVLNARLRGLMERGPARRARFIVNVSAMEGKFYRTKTTAHPHTNMAKAALNMMTRTSAADYAESGIYMNSVDTGWINDENPAPTAHARFLATGESTPLDEVDAAARVLDPVFSAVNGCEPVCGQFLKNYKPTAW